MIARVLNQRVNCQHQSADLALPDSLLHLACELEHGLLCLAGSAASQIFLGRILKKERDCKLCRKYTTQFKEIKCSSTLLMVHWSKLRGCFFSFTLLFSKTSLNSHSFTSKAAKLGSPKILPGLDFLRFIF